MRACSRPLVAFAATILGLGLMGCAHAPRCAAAADSFASSADGVEIVTSLESRQARGGER